MTKSSFIAEVTFKHFAKFTQKQVADLIKLQALGVFL